MDRDMYSAVEVLAGLALAFLLVGVVGLRQRSARIALVALGPMYSIVVFAYFLVAGAGSACSGEGATFRCWEVSYASTWGVLGSVMVGLVMILTFAPIASAWLRSRLPSAVAAMALGVLIALNLLELWIWVPAWAGLVAAAVAGPPSRGIPNGRAGEPPGLKPT